MKTKLFLSAITLTLIACEAPDIPAMNKGMKSMPTKTAELAEDMKKMKQATHLLTLSTALEGLNKYENHQLLAPLPTGFMAFAKVFAEEATPFELMDITHVWLNEIEKIMPTRGLGTDGGPIAVGQEDLEKARLLKTARLYSAILVAGFAQDDKVDQVIQEQIYSQGRFQKRALEFLALRAFFFREIILKVSMGIDSSSADTLNNSGMMNEAITYLLKLEKISRLPFADAVRVKLSEKTHNLLEFEEAQDAEGRAQTAGMWKMALEKAVAGSSQFQNVSYTPNPTVNNQAYEAEKARQVLLMQTLKAHSDAWLN